MNLVYPHRTPKHFASIIIYVRSDKVWHMCPFDSNNLIPPTRSLLQQIIKDILIGIAYMYMGMQTIMWKIYLFTF